MNLRVTSVLASPDAIHEHKAFLNTMSTNSRSRRVCDTSTGLCVCIFGFTGKACDRKQCPNNCNGKGQCISMGHYAEDKDPGEGPVYAYNGWDKDMLQGCVCDPGWSGPECLIRTCPSGDDPMTTGQSNEVHTVTCMATGGDFWLQFRRRRTRAPPATHTPTPTG